jgi:hypothetical protein
MIIGSSSTYTIQARGWLIITTKDNKNLYNRLSKEWVANNDLFCFWFVSESQSQNMIILGRSSPGLFVVLCTETNQIVLCIVGDDNENLKFRDLWRKLNCFRSIPGGYLV